MENSLIIKKLSLKIVIKVRKECLHEPKILIRKYYWVKNLLKSL